MRVFKTKLFARFARQEGISDDDLCEAIDRAIRGLIDADLGGGVIKQRIARQGEGRSSGYRTLIACRFEETAYFIFGFAKSARENVDAVELAALKKLAALLLSLEAAGIAEWTSKGSMKEVDCHV